MVRADELNVLEASDNTRYFVSDDAIETLYFNGLSEMMSWDNTIPREYLDEVIRRNPELHCKSAGSVTVILHERDLERQIRDPLFGRTGYLDAFSRRFRLREERIH